MVTGVIPEPMGWEDALSGLEGPDFWRRILVAEIARSGRYERPMTVVVIELEGLSELADVWGSEVARQAVRAAGQCLRRTSRSSDYCTRIEVSRFGVVLTETDEIAAINFVENVRETGPQGDGAQRRPPALPDRLGEPETGRVGRRPRATGRRAPARRRRRLGSRRRTGPGASRPFSGSRSAPRGCGRWAGRR